jgi:benzoyl-CoA reductase/2-hydroxyglutaryl-CoA dehydratase subunit BcrC/BadD/HgdB
MITAAGLVPYRITGTLEPITQADTYLETCMCPFVRSCFDLALKKRLSFLEGIVYPHTCDNIHRTHDPWKTFIPSPYFHYIDVPHMTNPSSFEFFAGELGALRESLG